jgi:hypothetical protein
VRPLLESYQALVKHLAIDGIILIDGGVDSLLHGDETQIGPYPVAKACFVDVLFLRNPYHSASTGHQVTHWL